MKLKEALDQIKTIEDSIQTPWEVLSAFGKIQLHSSQVAFGETNDFLTEEDLKQALTILVEQLDGKVKWNKSKKQK